MPVRRDELLLTWVSALATLLAGCSEFGSEQAPCPDYPCYYDITGEVLWDVMGTVMPVEAVDQQSMSCARPETDESVRTCWSGALEADFWGFGLDLKRDEKRVDQIWWSDKTAYAFRSLHPGTYVLDTIHDIDEPLPGVNPALLLWDKEQVRCPDEPVFEPISRNNEFVVFGTPPPFPLTIELDADTEQNLVFEWRGFEDCTIPAAWNHVIPRRDRGNVSCEFPSILQSATVEFCDAGGEMCQFALGAAGCETSSFQLSVDDEGGAFELVDPMWTIVSSTHGSAEDRSVSDLPLDTRESKVEPMIIALRHELMGARNLVFSLHAEPSTQDFLIVVYSFEEPP